MRETTAGKLALTLPCANSLSSTQATNYSECPKGISAGPLPFMFVLPDAGETGVPPNGVVPPEVDDGDACVASFAKVSVAPAPVPKLPAPAPSFPPLATILALTYPPRSARVRSCRT